MFVVYGKPECPWCDRVKDILRGQAHTYIDLSKDDQALEYIRSQGHKTVPQVYRYGEHIGGYEATNKFLKENKIAD